MRKEILIAIIAGSLIGLIIAFGIWRANSSLKKSQGEEFNEAESLTNPEAAPSPETQGGITLLKPQNDDVSTSDTITFTGATKPLAWITISAENDDYVFQAQSDGSFSQDVKLIAGINQISVSALSDTGSVIGTKNLNIVYSTEVK